MAGAQFSESFSESTARFLRDLERKHAENTAREIIAKQRQPSEADMNIVIAGERQAVGDYEFDARPGSVTWVAPDNGWRLVNG